jgi:hypothetical protein
MSHNWEWVQSGGSNLAECSDCGIQSDRPVHGKCPGIKPIVRSEVVTTGLSMTFPVATTGTTGGKFAAKWQGGDTVQFDFELSTCPIVLRGVVRMTDEQLIGILESKGYRVTRP